MELTTRTFLEKEREDYGKNVTTFDGGKRKASRMGVDVTLEDGKPVSYHTTGLGGSFSPVQWDRFCNLIGSINEELL